MKPHLERLILLAMVSLLVLALMPLIPDLAHGGGYWQRVCWTPPTTNAADSSYGETFPLGLSVQIEWWDWRVREWTTKTVVADTVGLQGISVGQPGVRQCGWVSFSNSPAFALAGGGVLRVRHCHRGACSNWSNLLNGAILTHGEYSLAHYHRGANVPLPWFFETVKGPGRFTWATFYADSLSRLWYADSVALDPYLNERLCKIYGYYALDGVLVWCHELPEYTD